MSKIEKHCLQCGNSILVTPNQAEQGRGKFCNNSCHGKYRTKDKINREKKSCLFCKNTFEVSPSKADQKFCSPECYRTYKKFHFKSVKELRICKSCNEEFYEYPSRIKDSRGHFCSIECTNEWKRRNRLHKVCLFCGKHFTTELNKGSGNRGQYCSNHCKIIALDHKRLGITYHGDIIEDFELTREIAYIIGLIASDGCLDKDKYAIHFNTKDFDQIKNYTTIVHKYILNYELKWRKRGDGCYYYSFTSIPFYNFCKSIGLTPKKSLTIPPLEIPQDFFVDFLRGEIDGDGSVRPTYYKTIDGKKHPNLRISISSASFIFLEWIKNCIHEYYNITGSSVMTDKVSQCHSIVFGHHSSLALGRIIYENPKFYLPRKKMEYDKFL